MHNYVVQLHSKISILRRKKKDYISHRASHASQSDASNARSDAKEKVFNHKLVID